jgi:hypothetical protein
MVCEDTDHGSRSTLIHLLIGRMKTTILTLSILRATTKTMAFQFVALRINTNLQVLLIEIDVISKNKFVIFKLTNYFL